MFSGFLDFKFQQDLSWVFSYFRPD